MLWAARSTVCLPAARRLPAETSSRRWCGTPAKKSARPVITASANGKKDFAASAAQEEAKQKKRMTQLIIGLAGAGILAIGLLIGFNRLGKTTKPVAEGTKEGAPQEKTTNPEEQE